MEEWEIALHEFVHEWKDKEMIQGVLVCGSYVTGNPSKRSDIDVHLILPNEVDWRERGNEFVHGYLIEYFANPPKQIRKYFDEDYNDGRTMSMVQFMTSRIIFDPHEIIKQLKTEAQQWFAKQYPPLNEIAAEIKKYGLWDTLDNLRDCYEQERVDFSFSYYNSLNKLFSDYLRFLRMEQIPFYQIYSYLTDPVYKQKYLKDPVPDLKFGNLFIKALQENDKHKMMKFYEDLTYHVFAKMGSFEIDNWKIRTPVEQ